MFGTILGGAFNLGTTILNNQLASERAEADRYANFQYNEMAANSADKRTRELYEDLYSPKAKLEQLKDAGLSPSLMYGGQGLSGQSVSGAMGSGSHGLQTTFLPFDPMAIAQISKINAETKLIQEQTKTEKGENDRGRSDILQILADAGLKDAERSLRDAIESGQRISNYVSNFTKDSSIKYLKAQADKMFYDADTAFWDSLDRNLDYQFNLQTFDTRCKKEQEDLQNLVKDLLVKDSVLKVNEETAQKLAVEVSTLLPRLSIDFLNAAVHMQGVNSQVELNDKTARKIEEETKNLSTIIDLQKRSVDNQHLQTVLNSINAFLNTSIRASGLIMTRGASELNIFGNTNGYVY